MTSSKVLRDCEKLTSAALRKRYRVEANSHRAMLSRRKLGALVSHDLLNFRDFLRHSGRCPKPGYTMDRLNNADTEYAPGKIAWRSKRDQSRNRSNVVYLTDTDGTKRPLAEWGQLTHTPTSTLHARRRRGFADPAVIHGPGSRASDGGNGSAQLPWPTRARDDWEARYRRVSRRHLVFPRPETRVEFLVRELIVQCQALGEEIDRTVPPDDVDNPQYGNLLHSWEMCQTELRMACRLVGPEATAFFLDVESKMQRWRQLEIR